MNQTALERLDSLVDPYHRKLRTERALKDELRETFARRRKGFERRKARNPLLSWKEWKRSAPENEVIRSINARIQWLRAQRKRVEAIREGMV